MPADKPTELSRITLKTWTRQPVPMISKHSAHLTPLPFGIRTWLWRYTYIHTCLLLLISMLWHRQAIFESKWDKLSSSAECRIQTQGLRHLFASRLNACWQTDWAIEDQAKNLNSTASWLSHLALATYMFVVVNCDALAQDSDFRIDRKQVVFPCWMQDLSPQSQTPNRQQTECPLTNRLSYTYVHPSIHPSIHLHPSIHPCPCWTQNNSNLRSLAPNRQQNERLLTNRLNYRGLIVRELTWVPMPHAN